MNLGLLDALEIGDNWMRCDSAYPWSGCGLGYYWTRYNCGLALVIGSAMVSLSFGYFLNPQLTMLVGDSPVARYQITSRVYKVSNDLFGIQRIQ